MTLRKSNCIQSWILLMHLFYLKAVLRIYKCNLILFDSFVVPSLCLHCYKYWIQTNFWRNLVVLQRHDWWRRTRNTKILIHAVTVSEKTIQQIKCFSLFIYHSLWVRIMLKRSSLFLLSCITKRDNKYSLLQYFI